MREAIDAASKLDEVPPILANAGRLSHKYQRFQGCRGKGFLYFQAVYWHHADSQLRERLQMEARILRRREVERLTLLSKASIYRQMQMGTFPMPLRLGQRAWQCSLGPVGRFRARRHGSVARVPDTLEPFCSAEKRPELPSPWGVLRRPAKRPCPGEASRTCCGREMDAERRAGTSYHPYPIETAGPRTNGPRCPTSTRENEHIPCVVSNQRGNPSSFSLPTMQSRTSSELLATTSKRTAAGSQRMPSPLGPS